MILSGSLFIKIISAAVFIFTFCLSGKVFALRYAEKYKVTVTTSESGDKIWEAGLIERQADLSVNRVYSLVVTFFPRQDLTIPTVGVDSDEEAEVGGDEASGGERLRLGTADSIKRREAAFTHFCNAPPQTTDGHPVSFLKIICDRPAKAEVTVSGGYMTHLLGLYSTIKLSVKGVLFSGQKDILDKIHGSVTEPVKYWSSRKGWDEMSQMDRAKIADTLPTEEEWDKEHPKATKEDKIKGFDGANAGGSRFKVRRWTVVDNHLPARELDKNEEGEVLHDEWGREKYKVPVGVDNNPVYDGVNRNKFKIPQEVGQEPLYHETLIKYLTLPKNQGRMVLNNIQEDAPQVLFLTTRDEESVYQKRHLILPFPNVLRTEGCEASPAFEMPVVYIDDYSPVSRGGAFSITGRIIDYLDGKGCIPEVIKNKGPVARHVLDKQAKRQEFRENLEDFIDRGVHSGPATREITADLLESETVTVSSGRIGREPDYDMENGQALGQLRESLVTIVYTLNQAKTMWLSIVFQFTDPSDHNRWSTITFLAADASEKERVAERQSRGSKAARGGAIVYDDISYFPVSN